MITRVLSVLRGADAGAARAADPALDINTFAVAEDIELTLVLKNHGVELGLAAARCVPEPIAGVDVPAAEPGTDITALLDSGVRICAVAEDLADRGLGSADLVEGVDVIPEADLAGLIIRHDTTLISTS